MEYRISTITAIAKINSLINLEELYKIIKVDDKQNLYYDNDDEVSKNILNNISFIEYGKTKDVSNSKGVNPKQDKKNRYKKKKKKMKRFDNQLTLIVNINNNIINMKIFKNGRIQMTGLKDIDNGPKAIEIIMKIIKDLSLIKNSNITSLLEDNDKSIEIINPEMKTELNVELNNELNVELNTELKYDNYKICLINSDFKFNHKVKRNKLYEFIVNNTELVCSYEPCIYPGVKLQYFYNKKLDGVCRCSDVYCSNKNNNSTCVKITIAVFESGCTIITGAKSLKQVNAAYTFIKNLLSSNISHFKKIDIEDLLL
jgi:TATA-box binding protein (TBP) (component of TFIID and TFIIIB)